MKSTRHGTHTSDVEVTNVSKHGFWLFIQNREVFLPFEKFPWFKDAPIGKILNVELLQPHHLYWPDLDVDLAVESIDHPERFPLVSRVANSAETKASRRQSSPSRRSSIRRR